MSGSGGCNTKRCIKKRTTSVQEEKVFNDDIIKLYVELEENKITGLMDVLSVIWIKYIMTLP